MLTCGEAVDVFPQLHLALPVGREWVKPWIRTPNPPLFLPRMGSGHPAAPQPPALPTSKPFIPKTRPHVPPKPLSPTKLPFPAPPSPQPFSPARGAPPRSRPVLPRSPPPLSVPGPDAVDVAVELSHGGPQELQEPLSKKLPGPGAAPRRHLGPPAARGLPGKRVRGEVERPLPVRTAGAAGKYSPQGRCEGTAGRTSGNASGGASAPLSARQRR